ncbi:ShlB/FhaC/HecB family hemolysin secretion/activation protein [Allosphingosinicella flava]|nr:ShlB/FhaC/HecB family hemolysin secretion/activation protein [Sphingosinicella flava]
MMLSSLLTFAAISTTPAESAERVKENGHGVAASAANVATPADPTGDPAVEAIGGIVMLPDPAQAAVTGWTGPVTGVDASRLPPPAGDRLKAALEPYVGRNLDSATLAEMVNAANAAIAASPQPFAIAALPDQNAANGVVQLLVVEGRMGDLRVVGAKKFNEAGYRNAMTQPPGEPVDKARLDADIAWINRNSFREANVVAAPGGSFGTVDLTLAVEEKRPWSVSATLDDTGTDQTDPLRVGAAFTWGNAFGRGDILSYQLSASPDFEKTVAHSLGFQSFLPWRHILNVSASYADIKGDLPDPFTLDGYSWSAAANYEVPLPRGQVLIVGFEFKQSNNNFRFADLPLNDNTVDVAQATIGWRGQFEDNRGGTAVGANLTLSPGGLTGRNNDETFAATRVGADATYAVLRLSLDRQTRLPAGFTLTNALRAQLSTAALVGSEQLSVGGWSSVRGFDEGRFYGDRGFVLRNELGTPMLERRQTRLRPYLFLDTAVFGNRSRLAGEQSWNDVMSAGAGIDVGIGRHLSLRASWGFQISESINNGDKSRGHVGLAATF